LRKVPGVTVSLGHDDFLLGYKGRTYWYELKTPDKLKKNGEWKAGALKATQYHLLDNWQGHYRVVCFLDEILDELGIS